MISLTFEYPYQACEATMLGCYHLTIFRGEKKNNFLNLFFPYGEFEIKNKLKINLFQVFMLFSKHMKFLSLTLQNPWTSNQVFTSVYLTIIIKHIIA